MNRRSNIPFVPLIIISTIGLSSAATVAWNSTSLITGNATDIVLDGTTAGAWNLTNTASGSFVAGGVTFLNFNASALNTITTPYTEDNLTLAETSGSNWGGLGSGFWGTSSPSGTYQTLLSSGAFGSSGSRAGMNVTFNNLTVGQTYLIQIWSNDSRTSGSGRYTSVDGNVLDENSTELDGGRGQFITGTFTADGTTQVIAVGGNTSNFGVVNALQIRAIPEPSTTLLSIVGLLGILRRRR